MRGRLPAVLVVAGALALLVPATAWFLAPVGAPPAGSPPGFAVESHPASVPAPTPGPPAGTGIASAPSATPGNTPATSLVPSPSRQPWASPRPADSDAARATLTRFLRLERRRRFPAAWQMLATPSRIRYGSSAGFAAERRAFLDSWGDRYEMGRPSHSQATVERWLPRDFSADVDRAFVIRVDYPALSTTPAGWDLFILAPDASGRWEVWIGR
jgi:hypothetical protein